MRPRAGAARPGRPLPRRARGSAGRGDALSNVPPGLALAAGLQGALLLARARPHGLLLFESTPSGVARTFAALVVCLPAYLALRLSAYAVWPAASSPARLLLLEALGFVTAWLGFALASRRMAQFLGREAQWLRFLAAWNWSNVVQYGVLLAATLLPAALGVPAAVTQALVLAALGYAIWLEWYVTRLALALPGIGAAAMVLLDISIGLAVGSVVERLAGR